MSLFLLCVFVIFGAPFAAHSKILPRYCSKTLEECVRISSCRTLNYDFELLSKEDQRYYVDRMWCDGNLYDPDPKICCTKYEDKKELLDCAEEVSSFKIMNGNNSQIEEFPWLVVLVYENETSTTLDHHCAGSLISNQHVLTAAHCINDTLKRVQLGKYDSKKHENCDEFGRCGHPTVTIDIEEKIKHEEFGKIINGKESKAKDIALIRLWKKVYFTDFIKPICLPSTLSASPTSPNLSIAGWGEGAVNSSVKQKLAIEKIEFNECKEDYDNYALAEVEVVERIHICAGVERHAGACRGDSGGSLSKAVSDGDRLKFVIEGIISSGYDFCGNSNKNRYPMLFTNVAAFEAWINEKMLHPEDTTTSPESTVTSIENATSHPENATSHPENTTTRPESTTAN